MSDEPRTYAELLVWHLARGTRPNGVGEKWSTKGFAGKLGVSDNTVRNYIQGRSAERLEAIEILLFGDNPDEDSDEYRYFRRQLRAAFKAFHEKDPAPEPSKRGPIRNFRADVPKYFTGREDESNQIKSSFDTQQIGINAVALHGMPGVGKSVLARAFAARYEAEYDVIWRVEAHDTLSARASLVELGLRLGLTRPGQREDLVLQDVIGYLDRDGAGILLIYEDAADHKAIASVLPTSGKSHIIISSNNHAWRGIAHPIAITNWDFETGSKFLRERSGDFATSLQRVRELSVQLGGHPLAHEQAGAYCNLEEISLDEYRKRFDSYPLKLLSDDAVVPPEYGRTVSTTFALAADAATRRHSAAGWLLARIAVLALKPIPIRLIIIILEDVQPPYADTLSEDDLELALRALRLYSLIEKVEYVDKSNESIVLESVLLHRLIRLFAERQLSDNDRKQFRRVLLVAFDSLYPQDVVASQSSWPTLRVLEPHVIDLLNSAYSEVEFKDRKYVFHLLSGLGAYYHYSERNYQAALEYIVKSLAAVEDMGSADRKDENRASSQTKLGLLYLSWDKLDDAIVYLQKALKSKEKIYGDEHSEVATALNNLGLALFEKNHVQEAIQNYKRAMRIYLRGGKDLRSEIGGTTNNLASAYLRLGNLNEAIKLFRRSLRISIDSNGNTHFKTAMMRFNLGFALDLQGLDQEALQYYSETLVVHEYLYDADDPLVFNVKMAIDHLKQRLSNAKITSD